MATKPNGLPNWTATPSDAIVEPDNAKKAQGWLKEKPPYQYFNWFWANVSQWLEFLDTFYDEQLTENSTLASDIAQNAADILWQQENSFLLSNTDIYPSSMLHLSMLLSSIQKNLQGRRLTIKFDPNAYYNDAAITISGYNNGFIILESTAGTAKIEKKISFKNCDNVYIKSLRFDGAASGGTLDALSFEDCNSIRVEYNEMYKLRIAVYIARVSNASIYNNTIVALAGNSINTLIYATRSTVYMRGNSDIKECVCAVNNSGAKVYNFTAHKEWEEIFGPWPTFTNRYITDYNSVTGDYLAGETVVGCYRAPVFQLLNGRVPVRGALYDLYSIGGVSDYATSIRVLGFKHGMVYFVDAPWDGLGSGWEGPWADLSYNTREAIATLWHLNDGNPEYDVSRAAFKVQRFRVSAKEYFGMIELDMAVRLLNVYVSG